jgi:hypothetical protein
LSQLLSNVFEPQLFRAVAMLPPCVNRVVWHSSAGHFLAGTDLSYQLVGSSTVEYLYVSKKERKQNVSLTKYDLFCTTFFMLHLEF